MDNEQSLSDRVDAGIAWADENLPGWRNAINFNELDMKQGDTCILGQYWNKRHYDAYNEGYFCGVAHYTPVNFDVDYERAADWVTEHGFTATWSSYSFDALTAEWQRKLGKTSN